MYRLETALVTLIGKFPTYMRPPYSSCEGNCQATMNALGYHIIYYNMDTDDYDHLDNIQVSKDLVTSIMQGTSPANTGFLSIAHEIHQVTATDLVPFMIATLKSNGYRCKIPKSLSFDISIVLLIRLQLLLLVNASMTPGRIGIGQYKFGWRRRGWVDGSFQQGSLSSCTHSFLFLRPSCTDF